MTGESQTTVAVCGATGRQGGAVTRCLLDRGVAVRALTRKPAGDAAKRLAALGAEVVAVDMEDAAALHRAFTGVDGVYSVQNGQAGGFDAEVRQGVNVADAVKATGVGHLVYGSAAPGVSGTGVPSWDAKLRVEDHIRALGLPATILRPMAFMEILVDKDFFPPVAAWRIMPALMGKARPVGWLAVDDLGAIASSVFERPTEFIGRELRLVADVRSIAECREIYRDVTGRAPRSFPMPLWLFDRFTKRDLTAMWRWLHDGHLDLDTSQTSALLPSAMTVRDWFERRTTRIGDP